MIHLAIPSFLMLEAAFLTWEIQTVVSSRIGSVKLATQSALASIVSIAYQICISASMASSTRISNLVGAGSPRRALVATHVSLGLGAFLGSSNLFLLLDFRTRIPHIFTTDAEVLCEMMAMLPVCAAIQICDAIVSSCNGIFCAVGRPEIANYTQVFWLTS
jgi:MATE family multidrug resistance protein